MQFLSDTLPINLYALTWLLPSGKLFMQANRASILYDYNTKTTTNLPDMPHAARVYPASAATAMLPLTPPNYYAEVLFCGGSDPPQWGNDGTAGYNVTAVPADNTCVRISPDAPNAQYTDDDYMMEGRSMGQFVMLPDGTMWMGNGVAMGTAGYGDDHYSVGQSYGQDPLYMPAIYNFSAPAGSRWNRTGLTASKNERMYHSTAILLPDSSILISGSNPNKDFTNSQWRTRTDVERWYPWYYNQPRPDFSSAPDSLSYGGDAFNVSLDTQDEAAVQSAKVVVLRPGFNTHAIAFGQRYLQLRNTYTIDRNANTTTLHVGQIPNAEGGPRLFQPGPAYVFLVVNGVPSQGKYIMVGNGQLGTQPTADDPELPESSVKEVEQQNATPSSAGSGSAQQTSSAAMPGVKVGMGAVWGGVVLGAGTLAGALLL